MSDSVWYLRAGFGLGLIFVAVSELLFYPVSFKADFAVVAIAYIFFAIWAVAILAPHSGGFFGFFAIACVIGFFAEGIVVATIYEAPPLTIIWTPVAWHAVISGVLMVWAMRLTLGFGSTVILAGLIGAYIGLWGGYFWPLEASHSTPYWQQALLAWILIGAGHRLLPHDPSPKILPKVVIVVASVPIAFCFVAIAVLPYGLISVLMPLCLLCAWLVSRAGQPELLFWGREINWTSLIVCAVISVAMYSVSEGHPILNEFNVLTLVVFGSLGLCLIAAGCFQAIRRRRLLT
ncbi:MAG: hypothetical protein VX444_00640 [Pseudomonadota bacterium]|nr:hypothetical protein [Pseudomonadota bacterium]